jgi:hypothetical protein
MTLRVGPIRRLYSVLSRTRVEGHPAASGAGRRVAAREPRSTSDAPRETICAPKPMPRRCLNEAGHKVLR